MAEEKQSKYLTIVIDYEGRPYIASNNYNEESNHIKTMIDETGYGFEYVPNHEYSNIVIHPLFKKSHKKWLIIDLLLQKYRGDSDKVCVFAPDMYWRYQPNFAVVQVLPNENRGIKIHGKVLLKIEKSAMTSLCEDWEEYFKEEDFDDDDDE